MCADRSVPVDDGGGKYLIAFKTSYKTGVVIIKDKGDRIMQPYIVWLFSDLIEKNKFHGK